MPGHRRFVETLRANLKNDPEIELVRLSDGNAVRQRSLMQECRRDQLNSRIDMKGYRSRDLYKNSYIPTLSNEIIGH